jgi:hypothetical protein
MLLMDTHQIVKRNALLPLPRSLPDPLLTNLRRTLDVDHPEEVNYVVHPRQVVVELQID